MVARHMGILPPPSRASSFIRCHYTSVNVTIMLILTYPMLVVSVRCGNSINTRVQVAGVSAVPGHWLKAGDRRGGAIVF